MLGPCIVKVRGKEFTHLPSLMAISSSFFMGESEDKTFNTTSRKNVDAKLLQSFSYGWISAYPA